MYSRSWTSFDTSDSVVQNRPRTEHGQANVNACGILPSRQTMPAHSALFHHVFLVRRHVLASVTHLNGIARLLPVEAAHARVGARRHAHAAADALVVVLPHHARLRVLVGGAHGTHLHAGGVLAMLAVHRELHHRKIWIIAGRGVFSSSAVCKNTIPERTVRNVIFQLASHDAG